MKKKTGKNHEFLAVEGYAKKPCRSTDKKRRTCQMPDGNIRDHYRLRRAALHQASQSEESPTLPPSTETLLWPLTSCRHNARTTPAPHSQLDPSIGGDTDQVFGRDAATDRAEQEACGPNDSARQMEPATRVASHEVRFAAGAQAGRQGVQRWTGTGARTDGRDRQAFGGCARARRRPESTGCSRRFCGTPGRPSLPQQRPQDGITCSDAGCLVSPFHAGTASRGFVGEY